MDPRAPLAENVSTKEEVMPDRRPYSEMTTNELFYEMAMKILSARLDVALNERLGRETPAALKRLADMSLPPQGPLPERPEKECPTCGASRCPTCGASTH